MGQEEFIKNRFLAKVVRQNHVSQYFKTPNIVGISFGRKIVHNRVTEEPAVVIYVMKKVPKTFLPPSLQLPRKLYVGSDCISVDVVETGPFFPLAFTGRDRPAPSGISIGNVNESSAGTLGCLVNDNSDGALCILSNNHVMARQNAAGMGEAILQPGVLDGGLAADSIATLKRFETLNATGNVIDAAIAQVINRADVVNQMKNDLMPVPNADHPAVGLLFAGSCNRTSMNPIAEVLARMNISLLNNNATVAGEIDMNVEKVGRTTEYTTSTILEIDATISINYGTQAAPLMREFDNQIQTAWMSNPGDSGSIVCRGGKGGNEDNCSCDSASAAKAVLQRDIKADVAAEKIFREKYLSQTITGRYVMDVYFKNERTIVDRVHKARSNKDDVGYAQYLYDKYAETFRNMILNPTSNKERISSDHVKEAEQALGRLSQHLKKDEKEAADQLFQIARNFEGKGIEEIIKMLDDKKIHASVVKILSTVESLKKDKC